MNATETAPALPTMTRDEMYARIVLHDATYNGRFFFGVRTTGVYCLPSCRSRRPLRGNVLFFADTVAARAAGLRPCRRCHPDDFACGSDPVIEEIDALVAEVRANPSAFPSVRALITRSGYGATRLFELFKMRLGTTPAAFLTRAKVHLARQLLTESSMSITEVAYAAGFQTPSVFHARFKDTTGMTASAYRSATRTEEGGS